MIAADSDTFTEHVNVTDDCKHNWFSIYYPMRADAMSVILDKIPEAHRDTGLDMSAVQSNIKGLVDGLTNGRYFVARALVDTALSDPDSKDKDMQHQPTVTLLTTNTMEFMQTILDPMLEALEISDFEKRRLRTKIPQEFVMHSRQENSSWKVGDDVEGIHDSMGKNATRTLTWDKLKKTNPRILDDMTEVRVLVQSGYLNLIDAITHNMVMKEERERKKKEAATRVRWSSRNRGKTASYAEEGRDDMSDDDGQNSDQDSSDGGSGSEYRRGGEEEEGEKRETTNLHPVTSEVVRAGIQAQAQEYEEDEEAEETRAEGEFRGAACIARERIPRGWNDVLCADYKDGEECDHDDDGMQRKRIQHVVAGRDGSGRSGDAHDFARR